MSEADRLIAAKDFTLDEMIKMLEDKLREPKWANSLTTNDQASVMALIYLLAKSIRKAVL